MLPARCYSQEPICFSADGFMEACQGEKLASSFKTLMAGTGPSWSEPARAITENLLSLSCKLLGTSNPASRALQLEIV